MVLGIFDRHSHILHCYDQRAAKHAMVLVIIVRSHYSTFRAIHSQPHQILQVNPEDICVCRIPSQANCVVLI